MSSPGSSVSKDRQHGGFVTKSKGSRSRLILRRLFLLVLILGALTLWQLSFVIKELGNLQHELETWKTTRALLGAFLTYMISQISHSVHSLWIDVFH
ncbi:hypothetical protein [Sulfobacillus thermosulfidooxidans]|uniref:Uncharacterized protein n=1 Tax=Sulfobacillus thermosulfidooxidans TaxID=28034 RepID=A0A1R0IQL7_SULTH|nr:hypothetical protein [Sulfobacillus thermosulfidooxidans]OLZ09656.1 hypothetical protein BFX05_11900 [Sulfobacillus thermosulfidooxidans]OLZ16037.1 hypothetical protein BFX06_03140 [Sulfobacillus thermosulfidooxidans]OLZ18115.1 hypothetical protein BFX07_06985 [Sulfobacillus thermosulfidooxidans]PSR29858.1 MAG: hypothetical protein C7B47_00685 [Sulfobacillus thermosulfidooxidans]